MQATVGEGRQEAHACWWEWAGGRPLGKAAQRFLTEPNTLFLCDPPATLLGVYANELKTHVSPRTCTRVWTAASSIIAPSLEAAKTSSGR